MKKIAINFVMVLLFSFGLSVSALADVLVFSCNWKYVGGSWGSCGSGPIIGYPIEDAMVGVEDMINQSVYWSAAHLDMPVLFSTSVYQSTGTFDDNGYVRDIFVQFGVTGSCDAPEVLQPSGICLAPCPVGQHHENLVCVPDPANPIGQAAYDAAIADGYTQAAAESARDAALAANAAGRSDEIALSVGHLAATIIQAGGTPAQAAADAFTAGTPSYYAGSIPSGGDPAAACTAFAAGAGQIGTWDAVLQRCNLSGGQILPLELIAPVELDQVDQAPPESEPLYIAIAGAGAYQVATDLGLVTISAQYAAFLAEQAAREGATPLFGQQITQSAIDAMIAHNTETLAAQQAAGLAAYEAAKTGASISAQQAAATAASNVILSGGSVAQAQAAGVTATSYVQAGGTVSGAVSAAGSTGTSTGGATESTLKGISDMLGKSDFGSVSPVVVGSNSINVAIEPFAVGSAGSCPVPSLMVLHGESHYFDWTTYCNFADGIRPILLAFAWLSAAGLLIGGFKAG